MTGSKPPTPRFRITATRIGNAPIIRPHMDEVMGDNINGPSLLRVPDWVPNPLGRYYLYFAHHDGAYIRLAFADQIEGPWQMFEPGVLPLAESHFEGHIASPDIIVDDAARQIRLYYHGSNAQTHIEAPQVTRVALSPDGLHFQAQPQVLGPFYMRVVNMGDNFLAMTMPGHFFRSNDGLSGFQQGPSLFDNTLRHSALLKRGDRLIVVFTRVGDSPESLLSAEIDITPDWHEWVPTDPQILLAPERDYEGGHIAPTPSERGMAIGPKCELRDPAILEDAGRTILAYAVAGESGIALAELAIEDI